LKIFFVIVWESDILAYRTDLIRVQCCVINDVCLVNPGIIRMVVENQLLHNTSHSKQNLLTSSLPQIIQNKIPTNTDRCSDQFLCPTTFIADKIHFKSNYLS
uniref:Secreted protein n=1 Tax=Onchocerca flexuosa TaxID=387005 RepID=A0A183HAP6_9BILA